MRHTRTGAAILLLGSLLLVLVWRAAPPLAPPLYDGLVLKPERYRYLQPPQGSLGTKPPTSARATIPLTGSASPLMVASTKEQPPQAQLILEDGAIPIRSGPPKVTLSITPEPAPSAAPDGTFDSNVYLFAVTTPSGSPVPFAPHATVSIQLRAAGLQGTPIIERYSNGQWARVPTHHFVTIPFYSTDVKSLGAYALVIPGKPAGRSVLPFILAGIIVLLIVALLLLLIRSTRRPEAAA